MKKQFQSYPEETLRLCMKGKPCDYGICDECPNTNGDKDDEDDEEK